MNERKFEVETTNHGFRYRLPVRDLAEASRFGWAVVGVGVLGCLFMIGWMSGPAVVGFQMLNQTWFGAALIAFSMLGLIGFVQTVKILAGGIHLLRNQLQCEVEIRGTYLYSTELLGWFPWRRRRKVDQISAFEIVEAKSKEAAGFQLFSKMHELVTIKAVCAGEKDGFLVAPGYPASVLEPLAQELAAQLNKIHEPVFPPPSRDEATTPEVAVKKVLFDNAPKKKFKQPADSNVTLAKIDGALTYRVPPVGMKGTRGLFSFSVIWLAFVGVIGFVMLFNVFQGGLDAEEWFVIGFISLFCAIGIGMLVAALNMAKRSVMIGIKDELLFIERKSIFGTKWLEFQRQQVAQLTKGPSGTEINDEPIMELQIIDGDGKKHGLLSQLDDDELDWLAWELNQQLDVSSFDGQLNHVLLDAKADPNWPQPPAGSNIAVSEMSTDSKIIRVPAFGIATAMGAIISGVLMIIGGIAIAVVLMVWVGELIFALVFGLFLIGIGAAFLVGNLIYTLRGFELIAKNNRLSVARSGLFGRREYQFDRQDITKIAVETSGWTVNSRNLLHLSINSQETSVNVMLGRSLYDLRYVTAQLDDWRGDPIAI